jgi:nicotinamide-nucleotide amidase
MFPDDQVAKAAALLEACRVKSLTLATAESCTGGLIAALLTSVAGASDVFLAGYVTYSNAAKIASVGVPPALLHAHGAVSEAVARAMAEGALVAASADIALAVTGVAGPGGGSAEKPVGLVHVAAARRGVAILHRRLDLGPLGREAIRLASVTAALDLGLAQTAAAP